MNLNFNLESPTPPPASTTKAASRDSSIRRNLRLALRSRQCWPLKELVAILANNEDGSAGSRSHIYKRLREIAAAPNAEFETTTQDKTKWVRSLLAPPPPSNGITLPVSAKVLSISARNVIRLQLSHPVSIKPSDIIKISF